MRGRLAYVGLKGGGGKTSASVLTAVGLARMTVGTAPVGCGQATAHRCVLLIDADPQGSLTAWCLPGSTSEDRPTTVDVLAGEATIEEAALPWAGEPGVEVVPSALRLARWERQDSPDDRALARALDAAGDRWPWVVIDTPPAAGNLLVAALAAVRLAVVPLALEPLGLAGLDRLVALAKDVRRDMNRGLLRLRLLATRVDRRSLLPREVEAYLDAQRDLRGALLEASIRVDASLARAPASGRAPHRGRSATDAARLALELSRILE